MLGRKTKKVQATKGAPVIVRDTYWYRDIGKPIPGSPRPMPSPGQLGK